MKQLPRLLPRKPDERLDQVPTDMENIQADLENIRETIYRTTGMAIRDNRVDALGAKVLDRISKLDLLNVKDYRRYLLLDRDGSELEELVNAIVISETYFFREYDQLQCLAEEVLPQIIAAKRKAGDNHLNLLSAGCATGEEPYTLAIILREMLEDMNSWEIFIDGVDINSQSLAKAKAGRYNSHYLRETPYLYRDRYFSKENAETYCLASDIKNMVRFSRVNIFNKEQIRGLYLYDIVFCRNVMIYFDRESAAQVMDYLHGVMKPGAFIFLGAAESVGRITHIYKMIRMGKNLLYQK